MPTKDKNALKRILSMSLASISTYLKIPLTQIIPLHTD